MPSVAPQVKVANTRAYGAHVVFYERRTEDRAAIASSIAARKNALVVPPYDDPYVIAGQGTAGLEICAQASALGLRPDVVIAPCSGGGLVAGIALAVRDAFPAAAIYAAEPADYNDLERSLAAGERVANRPAAPSICDALMAERPGALTFPIHRRMLAGSRAVSDEAVLDAMNFALRHLKLVVEPGGAAGLAAALAMRSPDGRNEFLGRTVVVLCSGGNADPEMIRLAMSRTETVDRGS
jgi:threonine dehydratase